MHHDDGTTQPAPYHPSNNNEVVFPDASTPLASTDIIDIGQNDTVTPSPILVNKPNNGISESTDQTNETKVNAISGAMAGFVAGILVCPLDVAKTRLQAQGLQSVKYENPYYKGIYGTLSTIVRDEGSRGLYKGLVPILLGYFPTWMIYFSVYEFCKKKKKITLSDRYEISSPFIINSVSAILAGTISTVITNPIWVVKTRLMLQNGISTHSTQYHGTIDAFAKIYTQEGLRALYSGLVPSLLGLFHVAIHFPVFERLKASLHCYGDDGQTIHLKRLIAASCFSKMAASIITYPHEILRTRMQLKSDLLPRSVQHRLIPLIRTTYLREGLRGFYSGFTTNLLRTVPASMVTLVSFEYFRNAMQRL